MPLDHISSLCCSVQVFLTLLGSCAVVRPSQASGAEKDKQSNKWGSGSGVLFSKRFCCCRTSNMSRHQLGQCSAHGPALNTGMPSAIDLKSDMHDIIVYECKTLSLRELVPSCAPGSFSVILVRFTCTAI